jgi:serine protease Do
MRPRSQGSGVVITRDGFFLTNVHVVEGAGYITVTLPGNVRCRAVLFADTSEGKVKGDIALLKLTHPRGERFDYVDWKAGNPQFLKPGSFVFAMGNPHGHARDGTPVVTMGVLSGKGRAAAEAGYLYVDALQTDAEINPGNSGGPLFDSRGNLIGINGLMSSRAGRSNSGIGFAIPIDQVRLFLRRLLKDEGGGVGYGFHGMQVKSEQGETGARIVRVDRSSPAEEAGLASDDVVYRINRKKIRNRSDFINVVGKLPEGTSVSISYRRGRRARSTRFKLIAYADYQEKIGRTRRAGPLPTNERGYLGFEWATSRGGLRVTRIMEGSGAEKAGLKPDDLVLEIDGAAVEDPKKLLARLAVHPVDTVVSVTYRRKTTEKSLRLTLCDAASAAGLGE